MLLSKKKSQRWNVQITELLFFCYSILPLHIYLINCSSHLRGGFRSFTLDGLWCDTKQFVLWAGHWVSSQIGDWRQRGCRISATILQFLNYFISSATRQNKPPTLIIGKMLHPVSSYWPGWLSAIPAQYPMTGKIICLVWTSLKSRFYPVINNNMCLKHIKNH